MPVIVPATASSTRPGGRLLAVYSSTTGWVAAIWIGVIGAPAASAAKVGLVMTGTSLGSIVKVTVNGALAPETLLALNRVCTVPLALGVPPMLLGIPGDNTYSNYQEASRSLWRQTVLPLVNRTAKAMSMWLAPAWGGGLELRPDLDAIEALSAERDQLWARLEKTTFLTADEKRAAAGYGPIGEGENSNK